MLSTTLLILGILTAFFAGYFLKQHISTPLHNFTQPVSVTASTITMETNYTPPSTYTVPAGISVTCISTLQWKHKQETYKNTYTKQTVTQENIWPPTDCLEPGDATELIIDGDHPRNYVRPLDALITTVLLTMLMLGGLAIIVTSVAIGTISTRED